MNAQQEATLSTLHDLIEICRDGEDGFRKASECVDKDSELKMLLMSFSLQRGKFARELEAESTAMGGTVPERSTSMLGHLHRWWMDLEAAIIQDNHAILAECERGEDTAKEAYHTAIQGDLSLPDSIRATLLRQQQEVLKVHDVIKRRRDDTDMKEKIGVAKEQVAHKVGEAKERFSDTMSDTKERLSDKIGAAKDKLQSTLQSTGHDVADKSAELWETAKDRGGSAANRTSRFVRENPMSVLFGALTAGLAIGLYFYSRELRNERARLVIIRSPLHRLGLGARATIDELRLRAKDNFEAVQDRMEDLQAKHKKGKFMKKLRKAWNNIGH